MIKPHGSDHLMPLFVEDAAARAALQTEAEGLPQLLVNSAAAANAVMMGAGYFTPLTGFMNLADTLSVAENLTTANGVFFPVPVLNRTDDISALEVGARVALRDPNVDGNPIIAVQTIAEIEELSDEDQESVIAKVFRTSDAEHPGVATFRSLGRYIVSGDIQVLNFSYFESEFGDTFRTATQIRNEIADRGWETVVAFQTRNPMHRAHEELCKMAKEAVNGDGILIHMLLGKLKAGDIPADVRDESIRELVKHHFPENTVMITGYGFDMLYAGPREAVLHALFRQNCGCTHLIVGRDHAGVGDYYGAFEAQEIFHEEVPAGSLDIKIFEADHTAFSKKLGRVVMMRDVPDHSKEDFVLLSGTKVRAMLAEGKDLPEEFSRPEVARILMRHYQSE